MPTSREQSYRLRSGAQSVELPTGELIIGRAQECGIALDDERLSRLHAKISVTLTGEAWLSDLGSRNGTFLNGEAVTAPQRLKDGDVIQMGQAEFTVQVVERERPRARSSSTTLGGATLLDISTPGADSDVLAMMFKAARFDEAEKILKARVANLLRSPELLAPEHPAAASVVDGMLVMAEKTMDAAWLHRLLKLYVSCQWWLDDAVQQRFEQLVRALGKVGGDGLTAYLSYWATRVSSLSESQKDQLVRLRVLSTRPGVI
jgi:pSer/pThr/pTyr-binding forkhead associated (FHA) protein